MSEVPLYLFKFRNPCPPPSSSSLSITDRIWMRRDMDEAGSNLLRFHAFPPLLSLLLFFFDSGGGGGFPKPPLFTVEAEKVASSGFAPSSL